MTNSAVPRTTSSMPSVTRNDGILSRVTNRPFTSPISAAMTMATRKPSSSGMIPWLNRVHITIGEKPNTAPTERSNSPAVIRSVIASAIRPSSTVKTSVLRDVERRQEVRVDRGEHDQLDHEQDERPELGLGDQAPDQRRPLDGRAFRVA